MTRKRNPSVIAKEREWRTRHAGYLADGKAKLSPQPDPKTHPKEFHAWMRDNARTAFTREESQLFADLSALPKSKLKRERDTERWDMIRCLIRYQKRSDRPGPDDPALMAELGLPDVASYDLMNCKLGKYPSAVGNAGRYSKGSKQLQDFLAILRACNQPSITPAQLFDSILEWRKRRREMSPPSI